jgi:hypothetical protein
MYKTILFPDKKNHSIEMPKEFFGKKMEVTVTEIAEESASPRPLPPGNKKTSAAELLKDFGKNPDFPSIEEIRAKAWPSKW